MGAYGQKLYIRRDDAGDVAKQTKALLLHGALLRKYRGYIHRKRVILLREVWLQSVGGTGECQRGNSRSEPARQWVGGAVRSQQRS